MTKELEAFHKIMEKYGNTNSLEGTYNDFLTIKKALQRLEQIDNAKPSEAMKKLDDISYLVLNEIDDLKNKELWKSYFNTIKQALIKAQEQEKVLKIIFKKNADINFLCNCRNRYDYNVRFKHCKTYQLTEEEFDLLKRWLDETK